MPLRCPSCLHHRIAVAIPNLGRFLMRAYAYMYVRMYVRMYICTYGWLDVCMYVWMDVCMDGWMYVWMDVCMYGCMDVLHLPNITCQPSNRPHQCSPQRASAPAALEIARAEKKKTSIFPRQRKILALAGSSCPRYVRRWKNLKLSFFSSPVKPSTVALHSDAESSSQTLPSGVSASAMLCASEWEWWQRS